MTLVSEPTAEGLNPGELAPGEIITLRSARERSVEGYLYQREYVAVGDESSAEGRAALDEDFDTWDAVIRMEGWEAPSRRNDYQTNPAAESFYNRFPDMPTMQRWLKLVPSAKALYPLQRMHDAARVFPEGWQLDQWGENIFLNARDSVAIRARARIMKKAELRIANTFSDDELSIVSLGCGAAVPVIDAVVDIREKLGKKTSLKLFDMDGDVLKFAEELCAESGIEPHDVETVEGFYSEAFKRAPESAHIVDALGLTEYLPDKRVKELLHDAYDLLKPGGSIIVSNMLTTRKQLAFNQVAIKWPGVKPRSEDQLVGLVHEADIDTEQLTYTTSEDGVYAVMEIRKP